MAARGRVVRPTLTPLEERIALSADDALPASIRPVERTDAYAIQRHRENLTRIRTQRDDVIFFGDSIIDLWDRVGLPSWNAKLLPFGAADFGINGDTTQNLLWRLQHGELDGQPKVAVVEIGINNYFRAPDPTAVIDSTVEGINAVLSTIQTLSPKTKVLVVGVIPYGVEPDDPSRVAIRETNTRVAEIARRYAMTFLDVSPIFLEPDGTRPDTPLGVHPSPEQYDAWADALHEPLERLLARTSAPRVVGVKASLLGKRIHAIVLDFDERLHAGSAGNMANYSIRQISPGKSSGTRQSPRLNDITFVTYNPNARTTILIPTRPLDAKSSYQLTINGKSPSGVRDYLGNFLDGPGTGQPGSSHVTLLRPKTLA